LRYTNASIIIRLHRSTTQYVRIVTDRVAWSVGLSVTLVSPAKTAELIEMSFGFQTRVGPWNHVFDGSRGNFEVNERPIVKYRDTLRSSVQKWLNRSKCHLGRGLGWAHGIVLVRGPDSLMERGNFGETEAHCKV